MCNRWRRTPLNSASKQGHHAVVSTLLAAGADVGVPDFLGRTALHDAATYGHDQVVSSLISCRANIQVCYGVGCTPLYVAAVNGHDKIVKTLLDAGAEVETRGEDRNTALYQAAERGYDKVVEALTGSGANPAITKVSGSGNTPLHRASRHGYRRIVKVLLAAGMDPATLNKMGSTPIRQAAKHRHEKIVQMLQDAEADGTGVSSAWRGRRNVSSWDLAFRDDNFRHGDPLDDISSRDDVSLVCNELFKEYDFDSVDPVFENSMPFLFWAPRSGLPDDLASSIVSYARRPSKGPDSCCETPTSDNQSSNSASHHPLSTFDLWEIEALCHFSLSKYNSPIKPVHDNKLNQTRSITLPARRTFTKNGERKRSSTI
jgi:ankyrin repeat protein